MSAHQNLLGDPEPTLLPEDDAIRARLAAGEDPRTVAAAAPELPAVWAELAETALDDGQMLEAYAFARVGYHRGLDALRRSGWRGHGPVPWGHAPNRGFLRCLAALSRAAGSIRETAEQERCRTFLVDCDPEAARVLGLA